MALHGAAIVGFAETRIETRAGRDIWEVSGEVLDESMNIITNVIGCPLDQIAIGVRVRPAWVPLPDRTNLLFSSPMNRTGAGRETSNGLRAGES